jgi:hypothetical protein
MALSQFWHVEKASSCGNTVDEAGATDGLPPWLSQLPPSICTAMKIRMTKAHGQCHDCVLEFVEAAIT